MLLTGILVAMTLGGLPDRGIWPDLDGRVAIAPAPWLASEGPASLRVDPVHKVLTVYRGAAAQTAYPLPGLADGATLKAPRVPDVLALARPEDRPAITALVEPASPVRVAATTRDEDQDQ